MKECEKSRQSLLDDRMKYMTTKEAAEKWGISDRRVRTLCTEGKIAGTMKVGKSYQIPEDTAKPVDGRQKHFEAHKYLKWDNEVVGLIDEQFNVKFIKPNYNDVLDLYTRGENLGFQYLWKIAA